jgi:hypothetical protein
VWGAFVGLLPRLSVMPSLEIENLHVEIDGKKIFKGVDLAVNEGPNGPAEVDILARALLKAQEFFT